MVSRTLASPRLVVRQDEPLNAETVLERLTESFVTPNDLFFVRNHAAVPRVDEDSFRLHVRGMVRSELSLDLDELKHRFAPRVVVATIECAGNRRSDFRPPIAGELAWDAGAIGTAKWTGVALSDVLRAAGYEQPARHVAFTGLDRAAVTGGMTSFGGSIPIEKALHGEVLLAYEMNDRPLDPIHGFPLRAVVPGYIGARSVKWLREVVPQDEPSANHFQASAYRLMTASDAPDGCALGEISLNAVICRPGPFEARAGDWVRVEGYAIGTGGAVVGKVEVSGDGGNTWHEAEVFAGRGRWAWCLWSLDILTSPNHHELAVRAWDGTAVAQPSDVAATWNARGYANNAWHRVPLLADRRPGRRTRKYRV